MTEDTNYKKALDDTASEANKIHKDLRSLEEAVKDTADMEDFAPVDKDEIINNVQKLRATGQDADVLLAWSARHAQGIANWKAEKTHSKINKDNLAERVRLSLDKRI